MNADLTPLSDAPRRRWRALAGLAALTSGLATLTACSSGGEDAVAVVPADDPTVAETLQMLGIDTAETPRTDHAGEPLPEGYSPLGRTLELQKLSELLVCGAAPLGTSDDLTLFDLQTSADEEAPTSAMLHSLPADGTPWVNESIDLSAGELPRSWRAGVGADVDGDGRQEVAFVYVADSQLRLFLMEDADSAFASADSVLVSEFQSILDVTAAAADLDGDGDDELVVGYTVLFDTYLIVAEYVDGAFAVREELTRAFVPEQPGSVFLMELETGNLDYDGRDELALVLNEYSYQAGAPDEVPGAGDNYPMQLGSTWFVLDDAEHGLAELASGALEGLDEMEVLRTALVADVAVGDLDADGIDEVVLGGIVDPGQWCAGTYVLSALDDAAHGLAPLASAVSWASVDGCESILRWAHVGTVDLRGDHASEIYVNDRLFYELHETGEWIERETIPSWVPSAATLDNSVMAMVAGDFTGDGREDLALWGNGNNELAVWGVPPEDPEQELAVMISAPMEYGPGWEVGQNPLLLAVNPDSDSTIMEFVEHRYLMTEPVVLAALAAPPCQEGIGQDVSACSTEFGNEQTQSTGSEYDFQMSASFIIGTELLDLGNGWDIQAKFTAEVAGTFSNSYATSTSMAFATGPLEDTVVATVVPYDQYTYRILNDPYEENIGELVQVHLPRKVITLQVERGFFNDAVGSEDVRIDHTVFQHTPGDIASYPRYEQTLDLHNGDSSERIDHGPVGVGQGAGTTTLGVAFATETGGSSYLGHSMEFEATTTVVGIKIGGSFGVSEGNTWSWSVGESSSFSGTVGSLDAEHFAEDNYNFGITAYWHLDSRTGQRFQVVNYWVE